MCDVLLLEAGNAISHIYGYYYLYVIYYIMILVQCRGMELTNEQAATYIKYAVV